jgi:PAS domain-containing protein
MMAVAGVLPVFGVVACSIIAAGAIIAILARVTRNTAIHAGSGPPQTDLASAETGGVGTDTPGTVFLFHGGTLSDATPAARQLISAIRSDQPALSVVAGHLSRRFPGLRERLRTVEEGGDAVRSETLDGNQPNERLVVESGHGFVRFTVQSAAAPAAVDRARYAAMEEELLTLRSVAEDAPQLIWMQDAEGRLHWANRAYLTLADRLAGRVDSDDPLWPARPILPELRPLPDNAGTVTTRVQVAIPGLFDPQWYEVASVRRGTMTVHFAMDASNIIAAEEGRQKFIQTLTKTFAHLSAGLAIFDRDRRLVLFNPAFLDLTTLPADFLSQRPPVSAVLDRLRDLQMLPEPKDYSSWRDRVAALEAAAVRGTYAETWSLPSGRTYRVTGRPHPDGAIAFLFEDISDEIHLTRHFRSELETAQSVLDSLDEAVAVFSTAGTLTMSNAAYADLWGRGTAGLSELGFSGELDNWVTFARSHPSPVWDRLRLATADLRDRQRWQDTVRLDDGRSLICRFQPLSGGASLVGFRPHIAETPRAVATESTRPLAVVGG